MMRTSPLNSRRSATCSPNILHLFAEWEKDAMSFSLVIWWIGLNLLIKVSTIHYHCRKQRGRDDRLSMFIKPCEIQRNTQNKSLQPLQESAGHLYRQPNCELHSWLLKPNRRLWHIRTVYKKTFSCLMINIALPEAFQKDSAHLCAKQYLRCQQGAETLVHQCTKPKQ